MMFFDWGSYWTDKCRRFWDQDSQMMLLHSTFLTVWNNIQKYGRKKLHMQQMNHHPSLAKSNYSNSKVNVDHAPAVDSHYNVDMFSVILCGYLGNRSYQMPIIFTYFAQYWPGDCGNHKRSRTTGPVLNSPGMIPRKRIPIYDDKKSAKIYFIVENVLWIRTLMA